MVAGVSGYILSDVVNFSRYCGMIKNLDHVAISVSSMERSLKFYRDIMGMEVVMDRDICDDSIGNVIDVKGARCRLVHLKIGNAFLELFEYHSPLGKNIAETLNQYDHAITHFAFAVDNFHEFVAELKSKGVSFVSEPVEFRPGVWCVYFKGPDGEVCAIRHQKKS